MKKSIGSTAIEPLLITLYIHSSYVAGALLPRPFPVGSECKQRVTNELRVFLLSMLKLVDQNLNQMSRFMLSNRSRNMSFINNFISS